MTLHIIIENLYNQLEAQLEQAKRIIETQAKELGELKKKESKK